jgi:hypothetical protein
VSRLLAWLAEWVRKVGLNAPYWGGITARSQRVVDRLRRR